MYRIPDFKRDAKVRFTFDHRTVEGYENESLASAILASKRNVLSRSFRFHRPRTVFCSTGECSWCAMEVEGESDVHACMQACREGLTVQSQNTWPSADWDFFGVLNLLRFHLTNTFYHRLFLRPKFMRQFYLRRLRFFTGVARVRPDRVIDSKRRLPAKVETDVAVIGGGITGLSAAITVAEHGKRVILIERRDSLIDRRYNADASNTMNDLIGRMKSLPNLEYWSDSKCVGIYGSKTLGVITPDRLVTLHAMQIILAVGALDALPLFVGNDLPGVISARLAERLIVNEGIVPGKKAVVWGTQEQSQRISSIMQGAGIEIVHQLQSNETILVAKGSKRVRAALVRTADESTRMIPCDVIVIAALQPRNELLAQAGGQLQWDETVNGLVAMRDARLQTSIEGLRVVGEAAGSMNTDQCLLEARLAGLSAVQDLGLDGIEEEISQLAEPVTHKGHDDSMLFPGKSLNGAGHICFCEDVTEHEIKNQIEDGYESPELIKRRTAIFTGTCQGKYCLANAMRVYGNKVGATTARPPATPICMRDLLIDESAQG